MKILEIHYYFRKCRIYLLPVHHFKYLTVKPNEIHIFNTVTNTYQVQETIGRMISSVLCIDGDHIAHIHSHTNISILDNSNMTLDIHVLHFVLHK